MVRVLFPLLLSTSAFASADLQLTLHFPNANTVYEPGSQVTYIFTVTNGGDSVAESTRFTMPLPPGAQFLGVHSVVPTAPCSESNGVVTCDVGSILPKTSAPVVFDVSTPLTGARYVTTATLHSSTDPSDESAGVVLNVFRDFAVTSTADSGPGSLRQAILDTNAVCRDTATCRVNFNLGPSIATIAPLTPLPEITSCRVIFDTGVGDFVPINVPRRVGIDGSHLKSGDGLVVHSACGTDNVLPLGTPVAIRGLAIYGFPWNGVEVIDSPNQVFVQFCFIGVDPTGTIEKGNGLRGVAAFTKGVFEVAECVIAGNARSGVFVWSAFSASIRSSKITHNGASGVFTNADQTGLNNNEISNNGDFGVAIARPVRSATLNVNSIFANGVDGIDRGLDFVSVDDPLVPNAPTVLDAVYDAASNTTRVTVRWDATQAQLERFGRFPEVYLYANTKLDGYGRAEAEQFLNRGFAKVGESTTMSVPGDLRGRIITASAAIYRFGDDIYPETTEISAGVTAH